MTQWVDSHLDLTTTALLGFLATWLLIYLTYKILVRPDYGMPVKRRLLLTGMVVHHDEWAAVPLWWSVLQTRRAIDRHWRRSVEATMRGDVRPGDRPPRA